MFRRLGLLFAALALAAAPLKALAAEKVDLLLVLAADVSRSVDARKFQLQREGYAAALADPRVLKAITSGPNGRIAVCLVEWSGMSSQKVVIDWTLIDGPKAAQQFGDRLLETPRSFADRTSISGGISFALAQFPRAPFEAARRTIDVSGDGTNNSGNDVHQARNEATGLGVTINGLAILSEHPLPWNPEHTNPPGGLARYYRENVIGGPGAFVIEAKDFDSFGQAIISKLIAEVAAVPAGQLARAQAAPAD
jgi:hypothetical protein